MGIVISETTMPYAEREESGKGDPESREHEGVSEFVYFCTVYIGISPKKYANDRIGIYEHEHRRYSSRSYLAVVTIAV
jgi:hypothetical protein